MAKDVKIEILYYKTVTDISLEFGLHGDYPLRILHSGCNSIEEFFKALKRAISRSEIILTVGGYDKEDYLPDFIACSIGKKCITPDYLEHNIISTVGHSIPDGSVPLAPKSRLFGGFLIESGPQTIISLVNDRKIRLELVNEFIVDYISEHHRVYNQPFGVKLGTNNQVDNEDDSEKTVTENLEQNSNEITDEIFSSTEFEHNDVSNSDSDTTDKTENFTIQNDTCLNNEEIDTNIVAESDCEAISIENTEPVENTQSDESELQNNLEVKFDDDLNDKIDDELDDLDDLDDEPDIYYCEQYHTERHRSRRKKRIVRIMCIILTLLVLLSTVLVAKLYPKPTLERVDFYKEFNDIYSSYGDDIASGFQSVKQQNNAIFTWLKFEEISVNHPAFSVVDATTGEFLKKLPNGNEDARGTLYSEFVGSLTSSSQNAIIYGNADNGGLFQKLSDSTQLISKEFTAADNRFLTTWQVFSVFTHTLANGYDYTKTSFENDEEYSQHLTALQSLSTVDTDKEIYGNEKLLILVGIGSSERYVLVACLSSVRVLSITNETVNSAIGNNSSTDSTSSDLTSSDATSTDEPGTEDPDDYHGDSPDIVLPPPAPETSTPTTSNTSSSNTSSNTSSSKPSSSTAQSSSSSSQSSSEDKSSTVSSSSSSVVSSTNSSTGSTSTEISSTESTSSEATSSSVTSTEPSNSDTTSSQASDSVVSSTPSSTVSSTSSEVTSSEQPAPTVDPIYTWDVELSCIDSATGIKYTGSAVNIVAMIIEDEMSPTIDPAEALIAQAVVKYNWLLNNNGMNPNKAPKNALDPNPTPQAIQYATAAKGMVLMYGNTVAKTYCHAYSAGKTSSYADVWGGSGYPYLVSVDCSVDEEVSTFITSTTYSSDKIKSLIKSLCNIDVSDMPKTEWLKPTKYDENGLYCLKIEIGGKEYTGKYVRDTLLAKSNTGVATIRSTAYEIVYNEQDDTFTVTCKGYGHGVGMSQRGAKAYAKQGWTAEQILLHFFPGTTLVKH